MGRLDCAMEDELKEIRKFLFGIDIIEQQFIIITPLSSIFDSICARYNGRCSFYQGIYSCMAYNSFFVIKCPQGIQAQDALFPIYNKKVLFVGYAGALDKWKIGDIVAVEHVVLPSGEIINLSGLQFEKTGVCGYSPALLGNIAKEFQTKALQNKCSLVDMEVAFCASISSANNNDLYALMLITDMPNLIEFWALNDIEKNMLNGGKKRFLRTIFNLMEKGRIV